MKHKQFAIITRGPSGKHGQTLDQNWTKIGINDVSSYYPDQYDYTFTADNPTRFNSQRQSVIINSPGLFVSRDDNWRGKRSADEIYHIRQGELFLTPVTTQFNRHYFASIISPFLAVQFSYYMGAKSILLCGVDLLNHPLINSQHQIKRVQKDFARLQAELKKNGASMYIAEKTGVLSNIIPTL